MNGRSLIDMSEVAQGQSFSGSRAMPVGRALLSATNSGPRYKGIAFAFPELAILGLMSSESLAATGIITMIMSEGKRLDQERKLANALGRSTAPNPENLQACIRIFGGCIKDRGAPNHVLQH